MEDLAQYEAQWRTPLSFKYKDLNISMAPPSSGGICLAQIFEMIAPYDLAKMGHNSTKSIQVIGSGTKSLCRPKLLLGDPDCENAFERFNGRQLP
jgi:gamma-glutamyltranspeptidase/glutathione hydrolase